MDIEKKRELIERQRKIAEENLNCWLAALDFEKVKKSTTPNSCLKLEKELKRFYSNDSKGMEQLKKGIELLEKMLKFSIDYKFKLTKKIYPMLRELYSFLQEEWIKKEYNPYLERRKRIVENFKDKKRIEREKAAKWTLADELTGLDELDKEFERESKLLFEKLCNVLRPKNNWIFAIYIEISYYFDSSFMWIFTESNKLCKEIEKKNDTANLDKGEVLKFYVLLSMIRSFFWNDYSITGSIFSLSDVMLKLRYLSKYDSYIFKIVEDITSRTIPMIFNAEISLALELESSANLEYIPDDIRDQMKQLRNEMCAGFQKTQNQVSKESEDINKNLKELNANFGQSPNSKKHHTEIDLMNALDAAKYKGKSERYVRYLIEYKLIDLNKGVSVDDVKDIVGKTRFNCGEKWRKANEWRKTSKI